MKKDKLLANVENLQLALREQKNLLETFGTQMNDVIITIQNTLYILEELITSIKTDGYPSVINKIIRIENILKDDFPVALKKAKIVCFNGKMEELSVAFQKIKDQTKEFFKECEEKNKTQTTRTVK